MFIPMNGKPAYWTAIMASGLAILGSAHFAFKGDLNGALILAVPAAYFASIVLLIHRADGENRKLLRFLAEKVSEIRFGNAVLRNERITERTRLVNFKLVLSFLVVSYTITTKLYPYGDRKPWLQASLFSFLSLAFGIWSLPGLVYAPLSVLDNLRFERALEVSTLLRQVDSALAEESSAPIRS